jgi:hypothetical protein
MQALRAFYCCLFKEMALFSNACIPDFFPLLMLVFLIYARRPCEHFTTCFYAGSASIVLLFIQRAGFFS